MNSLKKYNRFVNLKKAVSEFPDELKCLKCKNSINKDCKCVPYDELFGFNEYIKIQKEMIRVIDTIQLPGDYDDLIDEETNIVQHHRNILNDINESFEDLLNMSYNIIRFHKVLRERVYNHLVLHDTIKEFTEDAKAGGLKLNDDGTKSLSYQFLKDYNMEKPFEFEKLSVLLEKKP